MAWKPNLDNVVQRIPEGNLLRKASRKVYFKTGHFPSFRYYDEHGGYALRYPNFILCAKKEIYGNVVSCHRQIVFDGIERKLPIMMWIDDSNDFYAFDPNEVLKTGEINEKGKSTMLNFSVKLGKCVKL